MGIYHYLAGPTTSKSGSSSFSYILIIIVIFIAFYFLMIRPQQRRRQQAMSQQNTVAPGARVRTTAGMYATVVAVDGDDVVLEVAPGIEVRYMKRAIMDVVSPGETYEPEEESAEEDSATDEPTDESADDIEAEAPEEQDDSDSAAYEKATGSKKD
jgi:preprotein translocase subunit YajC